jgi:iron only hydrogenase large subunit-like protein
METVTEFHERKTWARRDKGKAVDRGTASPEPGPLPMLASACPGWVCYAEKAQGDLLPLLSSVRSSQGLMGGLVKNWWGKRVGLT